MKLPEKPEALVMKRIESKPHLPKTMHGLRRIASDGRLIPKKSASLKNTARRRCILWDTHRWTCQANFYLNNQFHSLVQITKQNIGSWIEDTSRYLFHLSQTLQVQLSTAKLVTIGTARGRFCWGRKTGEPGLKPSGQAEITETRTSSARRGGRIEWWQQRQR